ncbi:MAG: hypothetical protein JRF30_02570 [Deltaproteobacteria bacterium]|nr:hypothetical protein [Deltaproteobacteria bacterium]MBW1793289.1 hypothetical protein [Deltaproteobacteria bacterium]MBW2329819.1 hypothetical protein [Deltaproteobacteria bacterium]
MIEAHGTISDGFEPVFLGHRWIQNSILEYRRGNRKLPLLKGRAVIFPEKHFAAALMHLYVGTFSLAEIADMVSVTRAELSFLRTQIDFMILVDTLKVSFTRYFRDKLILNEYRPGEYASIAAEYATFEELARNQIRLPLFRRMKALATSISDKVKFDLSVDLYDLQTFKKLFSFFVFEESFLPALSKPSFQHLKRVAKEIVWKRLRADYDELDSLLCLDLPGNGVKDALRKFFAFLKLQQADFTAKQPICS